MIVEKILHAHLEPLAKESTTYRTKAKGERTCHFNTSYFYAPVIYVSVCARTYNNVVFVHIHIIMYISANTHTCVYVSVCAHPMVTFVGSANSGP